MIPVQIAISKLARAGLTAWLSERKDPRLMIKCNASTYRSLVVLDGFISDRAFNTVLLAVAKEARLEAA
jgi:hypothetical protein